MPHIEEAAVPSGTYVDTTTAQTKTAPLSFRAPSDSLARLTFDAATGRILGGLGAAAPVLEFKTTSNGSAFEFNKGNLKLRADTSPTVTADLHFHSLYGCGADHANWGVGIDVLGGRPDPLGPTAGLPARDIAIYKFNANGTVTDSLYGLNRGGNYMPTWGIGNGSAQNSHLLTLNPDSTEG